MSALQLLQAYASDESEEEPSDEEFNGFGEDFPEDQFPPDPLAYAAICKEVMECTAAELAQAAQPEGSSCDANLADGVSEADGQSRERSFDPSTANDMMEAEGESNAQPFNDTDDIQEITDPESDSADEVLDSDGSFLDISTRKRKRTKKEKMQKKRAKQRRLNHKLLMTKCGCKKNCDQFFSKDQRVNLHDQFWNLTYEEQRNFIRKHVQRSSVHVRRRTRYDTDPKKHFTYIFHLSLMSGDEKRVCRKFFLNTIRYGDHCGNIIYRCLDHDFEGNAKMSKRGKYERSTAKREAVKAHIMSFNPSISHYRREHAPHRLYLPNDYTETSMHRHYKKTTSPELWVSYGFYTTIMAKMNISIVKLGNEQCEECVSAELHKDTAKHTDEDSSITECSICKAHAEHSRLADLARSVYRHDGSKIRPKEIVLAVDLQKVIQLPRMEGMKSIIFTQRVLAFNETFAPVGKYTQSFPVVACIWNEAVSGRSAGDIASCFSKVVQRYNDMDKITFWLDNCSSQNKNWNLFLYLILLLNTEGINVKKIVLKYFESGHTFMAADSFHAAVERNMRNGAPATTIPEFKDVIQNAQANVEAMDLAATDFFDMKLTVSQYTLNHCKPRPYVDNIKKIIFTKGSYKISYTDSIDGLDGLKSCCILSKKQMKIVTAEGFEIESILTRREAPVGICRDRKQALLRAILPVVREDQKQFWIDVPERHGTAIEE